MPGSLPTTSRENAGGRVAAAKGLGRAREGWAPRRGCGTPREQAVSLRVKFVSSGDRSPAAHRPPWEAWPQPRVCAQLSPDEVLLEKPPRAGCSRAPGGRVPVARLPEPLGSWGISAGPRGKKLARAERLGLGHQEGRPGCDPYAPPCPRRQSSEPVLSRRLAPEKQKPGDVGSAPGR